MMTQEIHNALHDARLARTAGRIEEAASGYSRAAELARAAGENLMLAHALRHVSDIGRERGFTEPALAAGERAVAIYRLEADVAPLDLANALRVAAMALQALNRSPEATALWQEARDLYTRVGVEEGVRECDSNIRSFPEES